MSASERLADRTDEQMPDGESFDDHRLSEDDVFHLLQSRRRRAVIQYLRDKEGPTEMRDLAEQVAAWENDIDTQSLTYNQRQRVYIPLYQSHLPKLDKEGIIDYNQSRGTIEKRPTAVQLERYLAVGETEVPPSDDGDRRWNMYYLGVSALGIVLLVGIALELPFLSAFPSAMIVALLMAFWAVSLGHSFSK